MASLTKLNKEGHNKYAELLGMKIGDVGDGKCTVTMEVTENHFHPGMIVHGGVAFSIADTCMAVALLSTVENGKTGSTIEAKMSYLAPVTSGTMIGVGKIVKRGRTIAFLEAEVKVGDKLVATATASFAIVDLPTFEKK